MTVVACSPSGILLTTAGSGQRLSEGFWIPASCEDNGVFSLLEHAEAMLRAKTVAAKTANCFRKIMTKFDVQTNFSHGPIQCQTWCSISTSGRFSDNDPVHDLVRGSPLNATPQACLALFQSAVGPSNPASAQIRFAYQVLQVRRSTGIPTGWVDQILQAAGASL